MCSSQPQAKATLGTERRVRPQSLAPQFLIVAYTASEKKKVFSQGLNVQFSYIKEVLTLSKDLRSVAFLFLVPCLPLAHGRDSTYLETGAVPPVHGAPAFARLLLIYWLFS